jgi:undecaprenyl-diphosphatase
VTLVRDEVGLDDIQIDEPAVPAFVRTWSAAFRVGLALALVALTVAVTRYAGEGVKVIERDALRVIENLAAPIQSFVVAVLQTIAAYAPLAGIVVLVVLRQGRRLALFVLAALVGTLSMRVAAVLADTPATPRQPLRGLGGPGFATGAAFPSPLYIAAATAIVASQWPWLASAWRRTAVAGLVLAGLARLAAGTSVDVPPDLVLAYAVGWFAGLLVLLVTGRPNQRVGARDIAEALGRASIRLRSIAADGSRAEGTRIYRAETTDGDELVIKLRQGGERGLDAAAKAYRNLRLRQPVGEHPFWNPQRSAEHEALVALTARRRGAPAPDVIAAFAVGVDRRSSILVWNWHESEILSTVEDARWSDPSWSDPVLVAAWNGLARLRAAGVAHRNLQLKNIRWDGHDIGFIDFDLAEAAADPVLLNDDVVELLCATAARVGPERAVQAATSVLDRDEVLQALPRLQPLVLTFGTRSEVRRSPGLLDSLRSQLSALEHIDDVPLAQLERLKPRTVLLVIMSALALYFVVPEAARYSSTFQVDELARADIGWVIGALAASGLSYVAAAIGLWGAVPTRISVAALTGAQVACQFVNFATPAQVGGMALNARFLQQRGTDAPVAVAAIGLNLATSAISHVALLGVFVYWAGTSDSTTIELPITTILVVLGIAGVVGLGTMAIPFGRRFVMSRLVPVLSRAVAGLRDVSRRPGKIAALIGGALLLSATYIAALACSVYAFGGDVALVSIGVVFLGSSVVAAAAPTPGGLGAVELSLVGGLTGIGVEPGVALYSVLVYRLATFWIPLVPGWAAFTWLQRRGEL